MPSRSPPCCGILTRTTSRRSLPCDSPRCASLVHFIEHLSSQRSGNVSSPTRGASRHSLCRISHNSVRYPSIANTSGSLKRTVVFPRKATQQIAWWRAWDASWATVRCLDQLDVSCLTMIRDTELPRTYFKTARITGIYSPHRLQRRLRG